MHYIIIDECDAGALFAESCYWTPGVMENWSPAHGICAASGGHHVYIASYEENEFLRNLAQSMYSSLYVYIFLFLLYF